MPHHLSERRAEHAQREICSRRNRGDGIAYRDDHLKDDDEKDQQQLARLPDAKEQHDDGQEGNLRDGIGQIEDRGEEMIDTPKIAHQDAERIADGNGGKHAHSNPHQAVCRVNGNRPCEGCRQSEKHLRGRWDHRLLKELRRARPKENTDKHSGGDHPQ